MRILVAMDGSEKCEAVIKPTLELAKTAHAEVLLLNMVNPLVDAVRVSAPSPSEAMAQVEAERRAYLEEKAKCFGGVPVKVSVERLQHGEDVAEGIARIAREQDAAILVVASRRVTSLAKLLLGSVAQELLRLSPCPVLVVRPD